MIFSKATRRKDVKAMQKSKATDLDAVNGTSVPTTFVGTKDQNSAEADPPSGSSPGQAEMAKADDVLEEDIQKSRQSTINLVVRLAPFVTHVQNR